MKRTCTMMLCGMISFAVCGCANTTEHISTVPPENDKWESDQDGLQISLTSAAVEVSKSQPTELILRVRNTSEGNRRYHVSDCCGPTFQVIASFTNGRAITFQQLAQWEHYPHPRTYWTELSPGNVDEHKYVLSVGTFLRKNYIFIGPLGTPLDQYGGMRLQFEG